MASSFPLLYPQLRTLLRKDLLLKRRSAVSSLLELLCPALIFFLGCFSLFLVSDAPTVLPLTTAEASLLPVTDLPLDPFPLGCAGLSPVQALGLRPLDPDGPPPSVRAGGSSQPLDCLLDALLELLPLWRLLGMRLAANHSLEPLPMSFGVAGTDAAAVQFKKYAETRWRRRGFGQVQLWDSLDVCFRDPRGVSMSNFCLENPLACLEKCLVGGEKQKTFLKKVSEKARILKRSRRFENDGVDDGLDEAPSTANPFIPAKTHWNQPAEIRWTRLGAALRAVKPRIRVFASSKDLDGLVRSQDYPRIHNDSTVPGSPYSEELCGGIVFQQPDLSSESIFSYTLRLPHVDTGYTTGASQSGPLLEFDTHSRTSPIGNPMALAAYTASGTLGLEVVVNEFLNCNYYTALVNGNSSSVTKDPRLAARDLHCLNSTSLNLVPQETRNSKQNFSTAPTRPLPLPLDMSHLFLTGFPLPRQLSNPALVYTSPHLKDQLWFGFCVPLLFASGHILKEKELRIRHGMRLIGLLDGAFYASILLFHTLWAGLICVFVTVSFFLLPNLVIFSSFFTLHLYLSLTLLSTLQLASCLTSFLSKANFGRIVVFAVVYASSLLSLALDNGASRTVCLLSLLLPPLNLKFFLQCFTVLELRTEGVTLHGEAWTLQVGNVSVGDCITLNALAVLLYTVLFWYFDGCWSGERRWNFFLSLTYWREALGMREEDRGSALAREEEDTPSARFFEAASTVQKMKLAGGQCVKVRNLRKTYEGASGAAVNGVDLTMYKDEVFVLLGHNGAGKTTTFSILTGLIAKTSGSCTYMDGRSMSEQFRACRREVGICPQHDIIWDTLTALEHLELFASFKGWRVDDSKSCWYGKNPISCIRSCVMRIWGRIWIIACGPNNTLSSDNQETPRGSRGLATTSIHEYNHEKIAALSPGSTTPGTLSMTTLSKDLESVTSADISIPDSPVSDTESNDPLLNLLNEVGLGTKASSQAGTLSGGQKRKLSLAMAFVGDPSLVFLDEPSSGMDSGARKQIWDVIGRRREGRVIILTTHYMDEAEALGDRIGVLKAGKMKCCGSAEFLKKAFGCGYGLRVNLDLEGELLERRENVGKFLKNTLAPYPVTSLDQRGGEMRFLVPLEASRSIGTAVNSLDGDKGVSSWTLSLCSLEEVFLKAALDSPGTEQQNKTFSQQVVHPPSSTNAPSSFLQLKTLLYKRVLLASRAKGQTLCQLLCPFLLTWLSLTLIAASVPVFFTPLSLTPENVGYTGTALPFGSYNASSLGPALRFALEKDRFNGDFVAYDDASECPDVRGCASVSKKMVIAASLNSSSCAFERSIFGEPVVSPLSACPESERDLIMAGLVNALALLNSTKIPSIFPNQADEKHLGLLKHQSKHWSYQLASRNSFASFLFSKQDYTAILINGSALHGAPTFVQLFFDALRTAAGVSENSITKVSAHLHPLPLPPSETARLFDLQAFVIAFNLMIAFGFVSAFSLTFIVTERQQETKLQQYINGVPVYLYHLANFLYDICSYLLPTLLVLFLLKVFNVENLTDSLPSFLLLLLSFSVSMGPFSYLWSLLFKDAGSALTITLTINIIFGSIFFLLVLILRSLPSKAAKETGRVLRQLALWWPVYNLGDGLEQLALLHALWKDGHGSRGLADSSAHCALSYAAMEEGVGRAWCATGALDFWYGIGENVFLGFVEGGLYFLLTVLIDLLERDTKWQQRWENMHESWARGSLVSGSCETTVVKETSATLSQESSAVKREAEKVYQFLENEDSGKNNFSLVVSQLCKTFWTGSNSFPAVKGVSFALKRGEVFGLLGCNGAGKTTLFRMMCGIETASRGSADVLVLGSSLFDRKERQKAHKEIGYCSQANPLWPSLTVHEHVRLYASLKGSSDPIDQILEDLGLQTHKLKPSHALSGGNKRKLCLACALAGSPPILFLDEPSAGMDPESRRMMWSAIERLAKKGTTVVLTTHCMAEAEALCGRVGMMVEGAFRCLGTPEELKREFMQDAFEIELALTLGDEKLALLQELHDAVFRCKEEEFSSVSLCPFAQSVLRDPVGLHSGSARNHEICFDEALALVRLMGSVKGGGGDWSAALEMVLSENSPFSVMAVMAWKVKGELSELDPVRSFLCSETFSGLLEESKTTTLAPDERQQILDEKIPADEFLTFVLQAEQRRKLEKWMKEAFASVKVIPKKTIGASRWARFKVLPEKDSKLKLGEVFEQIQKAKSYLEIEQFIVTPASLEDVFNEITLNPR